MSLFNLVAVLLSLFWAAAAYEFPVLKSRENQGSYNYSTTTEHCQDLWSYPGTEEAPIIVSNVTYYAANSSDGTPAFCELTGQVAVYNGVVVRLPAEGKDWAGIIHQQGCGGPCGYKYMDTYWADLGGWSWSRSELQRGYLTSTTDLGHNLSDYNGFLFAYSNRTAEINFAYMGTHLLVETDKAIAKFYYGVPHRLSLYRGSSTGGRQGIVAAQRYPADFDGVVGHPASNETAIGSMQETWLGITNKDEDGRQVLLEKDMPILNEAAIKSCDHLDGLVDGLIDNADRCVIDWGLLDCNSTRRIFNDTACFTKKMIKHAKLMYTNPRDSSGRELIRSSLLPGSEMSWSQFYVSATGEYDSACYNGSVTFNIGAAFEEDFLPLDWKPEQYDWDKYPQMLNYMEALYTGNHDLTTFRDAGGKFLMTQGWWDFNVTPQFTVKYWLDVLEKMGDVSDFARLFMTNGQYHTWGTGPGATSNLRLMDLVQKWIEEGEAPDRIIGQKLSSNGTVLFERPAFPYPNYAWYTGEGDWKNPYNWESRSRDDLFQVMV